MAKYNREEYKLVKKLRKKKNFWRIVHLRFMMFYLYSNSKYEKYRSELLAVTATENGKMNYKDWLFSRFTISNVKWYFRTKNHLKEGKCVLVDGYTNLVFYKEDKGTCVLNPFKYELK